MDIITNFRFLSSLEPETTPAYLRRGDKRGGLELRRDFGFDDSSISREGSIRTIGNIPTVSSSRREKIAVWNVAHGPLHVRTRECELSRVSQRAYDVLEARIARCIPSGLVLVNAVLYVRWTDRQIDRGRRDRS